MAIDRDLAVGHFARRPAILAGHPHRVAPALLKAGIIKDEHPIAFAGQGLQAGDPLPVEGVLIPDHLGQQMIELLLVGLGNHRGQSVTVFVGLLTKKAGEILTQGLRTRPLGKMHAQRRQKLRQLWQRRSRCLWQSLSFLGTEAHSPRLSQITDSDKVVLGIRLRSVQPSAPKAWCSSIWRRASNDGFASSRSIPPDTR